MGAYYMDSSALVKRYANETGSLWVRSLTDPQAGHDLFTAHITGIEVVAAIARKSGTGSVCCRSIRDLHLSSFWDQEYLLEGEALLQHS
jgi:predicted nucleic acid-binding protein